MRSGKNVCIVALALLGAWACGRKDEPNTGPRSGAEAPLPLSERQQAIDKPAAWCMYYEVKERGTVGSCSRSERACLEWTEESKPLNGGYNYTKCQSQEQLWCYRMVRVSIGVNDWLECFPSEPTCKGGHLGREENGDLVSERCELVDAAPFLADYQQIENGPDMLAEDAKACGEALRKVQFKSVPVMRPRAELLYCQVLADLGDIRRARDVCSASNMAATERERIAAALLDVEQNQADVAAKFCTPQRVRCYSAADLDACLSALPWPRAVDIHRPEVLRAR